MKDFADLAAARRSIRKFKSEPLPRHDLEEIVRIGTLAPSASNKQMWRFVAVTNKALIGNMHDAVAKKMDLLAEETAACGSDKVIRSMRPYATLFKQAPCVLVVLQEPYHSKIETALLEAGHDSAELSGKYGHGGAQSIGAAIENILLAATAKGYGACWMCAPLAAQDELCTLLQISPPWTIAALVPMGIPDEAPEPRPRKPVEEVLTIVE